MPFTYVRLFIITALLLFFNESADKNSPQVRHKYLHFEYIILWPSLDSLFLFCNELIFVVIIQMNKLTQEEIDKLVNESDEQGEKLEKKDIQAEVEQNYEQQYQNQLNEEIIDEQSRYKNEDQDHNFHNMEQVASEIQEENGDYVTQEKISRLGTESKFKNDEDLSLAKSQFIESVQINNQNKKNRQNTPLPQVKGLKPKQGKKEQTKFQKKDIKKQNKLNNKKKVQNVEREQKKQKLSESQINKRMKEIKESKQQLLRKKQQKQKKLLEIRRKEYQQAKKQQEEKKQRNKKILQQQRLKKKNENNLQPKKQKNNLSQIKMPQKCTDFQYMDMKKQKKKEQKKIQKQIEQENKAKLKKILEKPQSDLKGEAKKAAIIEQRKILKDRQQKMKLMESKEEDILIIKQTKQEINEAKKFNLQKTEQINRAEKAVTDLLKKVKQKQNQYFKLYNIKISQPNEQFQQNDLSEATPIQKFVACFPEAKNSDDIFKLIDSNGDGVMSSQEIKEKLKDLKIEEDIIRKVEEILDQNSDGTVSNQQFVFKIGIQLKKQKDFKEILGNIQVTDPLQLQAKILDMQAKIKFINTKLQTHQKKLNSSQNQQKIEKLEEKLKKVENKWKKQTEGVKEENKKIDISSNTIGDLVNELIKLKNQKKIKQAFIEKLKIKVKENIQQKNKLLTSRVQESLRLEQQIFKLQNQIQEDQLRYLSLKKIKENKKGYYERQSKYQKEREEAYKRTKQYQISITDPGKQAQIIAQKDEMKLLAAVLMIQRNYRRRKARGEFQKLKQTR